MTDTKARTLSVLLAIINIAGAVLLLPMLMATAMSFDAVEQEAHWAHKLFVFGTLAFPMASLVGLASKHCRWAGLVGLVAAVIGWVVLGQVCNGEFACRGAS